MFFSWVFTYPSFPQPLSWPTGQVDLQVWKNVMITLMKDNDTFAIDTYNLLVPEPAGPQVPNPTTAPCLGRSHHRSAGMCTTLEHAPAAYVRKPCRVLHRVHEACLTHVLHWRSLLMCASHVGCSIECMRHASRMCCTGDPCLRTVLPDRCIETPRILHANA
jgi:hypothetical protein